ncbi:endogenous retrovirus group FC1 Env polyprotein-like [Anolis carolinensis]|uniref:endogenous retrovirus group FC1 Env polyprotein-like n=1 Tax=Anolis carolinensis TaxID=28377 RepID=UPI002F2B3A0F
MRTHLYLLILIMMPLVQTQMGWDKNMFHQLIKEIAKEAEVADCWICAHSPHSQYEGWVMKAGPLLDISGWKLFTPWTYEREEGLTDSAQFLLALDDSAPAASACLTRSKEGISEIDHKNFPQANLIEVGDYPRCNLTLPVYYDNIHFGVEQLQPQQDGHTQRLRRQAASPEGGDKKPPSRPARNGKVNTPPKIYVVKPGSELPRAATQPPEAGAAAPPQPPVGGAASSPRSPVVKAAPPPRQDLIRTRGNFPMEYQIPGRPRPGILLDNHAMGGLPPGYFWICGKWGGKVLPPLWVGTCTIGTLVPTNIGIHPREQPLHALEAADRWNRPKRSYDEKRGYDPDNTYLSEGERFATILFPSLGVALNVKQLRRLSAQLEILANQTVIGMKALQTEIDSLAGVLMQHKMALDYLLAAEGGLCIWLNTTCCHYVNESGLIESDVAKINTVVSTIRATYTPKGTGWFDWLFSWLPNLNWLRDLVKVLFIILLIILLALLFLPCIMSCLRNMMARLITATFSQHREVQRVMYMQLNTMEQETTPL